MKAIILCIDKTQKLFFLKNPISKNKKQKNKQNVIFQLRQFSIFFYFLVIGLLELIDLMGINVA